MENESFETHWKGTKQKHSTIWIKSLKTKEYSSKTKKTWSEFRKEIFLTSIHFILENLNEEKLLWEVKFGFYNSSQKRAFVRLDSKRTRASIVRSGPRFWKAGFNSNFNLCIPTQSALDTGSTRKRRSLTAEIVDKASLNHQFIAKFVKLGQV